MRAVKKSSEKIVKRQKTIKYYFQINVGIFRGFIVGMAIVGGLIKRDRIAIRFIGMMSIWALKFQVAVETRLSGRPSEQDANAGLAMCGLYFIGTNILLCK